MKKKFKELEIALKNNKRNDAIEILNRKKNKPGILTNLKNNNDKLSMLNYLMFPFSIVFMTYPHHGSRNCIY